MHRHDIYLHAEVRQLQFNLARQGFQRLLAVTRHLFRYRVQQLKWRQRAFRKVFEQRLLPFTHRPLAGLCHFLDQLRLNTRLGFVFLPNGIGLANFHSLSLGAAPGKPVTHPGEGLGKGCHRSQRVTAGCIHDSEPGDTSEQSQSDQAHGEEE
jgi:hypothetical protein